MNVAKLKARIEEAIRPIAYEGVSQTNIAMELRDPESHQWSAYGLGRTAEFFVEVIVSDQLAQVGWADMRLVTVFDTEILRLAFDDVA